VRMGGVLEAQNGDKRLIIGCTCIGYRSWVMHHGWQRLSQIRAEKVAACCTAKVGSVVTEEMKYLYQCSM